MCHIVCRRPTRRLGSARLETGGRGGLWKRRQEGYSNRLHIRALNIIQVLFGKGCIPFRCISFYHSTSLALFQLRVKRRCRKSSAKVPFKPVDLAAPNVQNMHRRHMLDFFSPFFVVFWGLFMVWILFWKSSIRVMFFTENQYYKRVNVWSAFSVDYWGFSPCASDSSFPVLSSNSVVCAGFCYRVEFEVDKLQVAVKVWKTHIFLLGGENVIGRLFL